MQHYLGYHLAQNGEFIPDIAIAGGFTMEDQIFKGLAIGAPYVKLIGMARGPLAAAEEVEKVLCG